MPKDLIPGSRLIAVNRFYWPDHSATSQILTDLATYLAAEGNSVQVITSRLRYDRSADAPDARLPARELQDGVAIRRVWSSDLGRGSMLGRIVDYLTFYPSVLLALIATVRRGDVILAKTDPPLVSVVAWLVARLAGARLVTWNQDLFPEFAAALGISVARSRFGRLLIGFRNHSLRGAALNIAINERMADRIARQGVAHERICVIPNWSDAEIRPLQRVDNPLDRRWGLTGRFVIAYSGNLGRAHIAERVAELVRRTHDLPGLSWLFIGGGSGMRHIERLIAETGAENIQVHPYQPRESLSASLSLADLHLVSLDPTCEGLIMPSKLYGVMAAGRATLFLGASDGAVAQVLATHGIGLGLDVERPESWRGTVAALMAAPERVAAMGARARAVSEARYHARHALDAWGAALAAVAEAPVTARGTAPVTAPVTAETASPAPPGRKPAPAIGVIAQAWDGLKRPIAAGLSRLREVFPGRLRFHAAFLGLVALVSVLALYPGLYLAQAQALKDATDPLAHVAAFSALALMGAFAWGVTLPLVAGLSGLALWLEFAQHLSPGREPHLAQGAGAVAGLVIGLALARLLQTHRRYSKHS